jgi:predicted MFS family arabinose efflux permease
VDNEESISRHTARNLFTRDFVLGFLALLTFIAPMYALIPTLPVYLEKLGSSIREIGILVGVYGVSSLLFRFLVGGVLAGYSERSVMIAGSLVSVVSFLASILLPPFWPFFFVRFLQGVALASVDTAALAFVIKVIPQARRGEGMGYFLLAPTFALAVAPSFGMWLINHYNYTVLFLACTGLSLCTFFISCRLKEKGTSLPERGAVGHSGLFFEPKVVVPAVTNFLQSFAWGALSTFLPLYAIRCGITNPGHFFTAIAIMLVVGRTLGGKILDTCSKDRIVAIVVLGYALAMIILSFSKTLPMFILVGLLWGSGSAFFYPASIAHALEYAGSSSGAAVGTIRAIMDLGLALGPVITGIIIPYTGYPAMFLFLAFVSLSNFGYFQFYVRKKTA